MAERAGFEPAEACTSAVFKTAALNHSTISPHQMTSTGNITLKMEISSFFAGIYLLFQEKVISVILKNEVMMSLEAVQQFYLKLENDPVLRQRALELQQRFEDQDQVIDNFIALGTEQGCHFTAAELVQFIFIHGKSDG